MATVTGSETVRAEPPLPPGVAAPAIGVHTSLTGLVSTMLRSARDIVVHTFEVAALESRLAGSAIATVAGIAFAILVLALSVWGLLLAAGVYGLMALGLGPGVSLLIAAGVNLALVVVLALVVPRLARRMTFPTTRRLLQKMSSEPESP